MAVEWWGEVWRWHLGLPVCPQPDKDSSNWGESQRSMGGPLASWGRQQEMLSCSSLGLLPLYFPPHPRHCCPSSEQTTVLLATARPPRLQSPSSCSCQEGHAGLLPDQPSPSLLSPGLLLPAPLPLLSFCRLLGSPVHPP